MSSQPFCSTARRTAVGRMHAVAVGGLDQQHVGLRHRLGIHHDRHVVAAEIAGEDEAAAADLAGDEARAQDVPGRREPRLDPARGGERPAEVHALHLGERALGVRGGVQRQRRVVLAGVVPVGELGLFLLEMGRVRQHDVQQIVRARRAVDRPGEAVAAEPRQVTRVVDVSVAQDHRAERARVHRERGPVTLAQLLQALEEPAVEQHAAVPVLEQVLGAGDRAPGTSEEGQGLVHSEITRGRAPSGAGAGTRSWGSPPSGASPGQYIPAVRLSRSRPGRC
jgi:hypothetical protein